MRRTRWDQKPSNAEPVPSGSRWSHQWNQENSDGQVSESSNENPRPIDFSNDSRNRHLDSRTSNELTKGNHSSLKDNENESNKCHNNSLSNNEWNYVHPLHNQYSGSDQNSTQSYEQHSPWRHLNQTYPFSHYGRNARSSHNAKWWEDQYDNAHDFRQDRNPLKDRYYFPNKPTWNMYSKFNKGDYPYEYGRRHSRFSNFINFNSYGKGNSQIFSNSGYNKYRNYKFDRRPIEQESEGSNRGWKFNRQNFPGLYRTRTLFQSNNPAYIEAARRRNTFDRVSKVLSSHRELPTKSSKLIPKILKKKNSEAEKVRKKSLAVAALKLKQSFLAEKKGKNLNSKKRNAKSTLISEKKGERIVKKKNFNIPTSIPKEGTSLEHEIDIKLSSSEWENVGRGEGGSKEVLSLPSGSSGFREENTYSDSDSVQSIDCSDGDSVKELSDIEECSVSDVDHEVLEEVTNDSSFPRRRRASDSCVDTKPDIRHLKRRVRSYSESEMNTQNCVSEDSVHLSNNLKQMLLNHMRTLNKNSIQEFINDPKSRKVQFIMNHLINVHKDMLSQRLTQHRLKALSMTPRTSDDRSYLPHSSDVDFLTPELTEQIKEILRFEESDSVQYVLDEVSMSLSNLLNGVWDEYVGDLSDTLKNPEDDPSIKASSTLDDIQGLDLYVVTPPPKLPATTITIPDSDNEVTVDNAISTHSISSQFTSPDEQPDISPRDKNELILPSTSNTGESDKTYASPEDLTQRTVILSHMERPPNPISRINLSNLLPTSPSRTLRQGAHHSLSPTDCHLPSFIVPPPPDELRKSRINTKGKVNEESDQLAANCEHIEMDMNSPVNIKVKQERPSPMMECGLCIHRPRSPHTPQCSFGYGIPSAPVAMMPGSPKPLGAVPPQRPLPHLASSALASRIKEERHIESFLNLEHVIRPTSQERPKNPAPPDNASSEPPSPLPIPPPQSTLHPPPPPPPLLFSSNDQFIEPPRPASPPPPQHSPRIKLERQTPQYICCCMRNECERSSSSRQSAEIGRRSSVTPQGQSCDNGNLRATPHSMYKFDPSYVSGLRPRTPHNGIMNMYSTLSPSSRYLPSTHGSILPGLVANQALNLVPPTASTPCARVEASVQTDVQTDYNPCLNNNVSHEETVTEKIDQSTSTNDLHNQQPPNFAATSQNIENDSEIDAFHPCIVSTSTLTDDRITSTVKKVKNLIFSGNQNYQLIQVFNCQKEILGCLDVIDEREKELLKEREKLRDILLKLHSVSYEKLQNCTFEENRPTSSSAMPEVRPDSRRFPDKVEELGDRQIDNSTVSSSQEDFSNVENTPQACFEVCPNDSQPTSEGERCTSTFDPNLENVNYKRENVSDEGEIPKKLDERFQEYWLEKKHLKRTRLNSNSFTEGRRDSRNSNAQLENQIMDQNDELDVKAEQCQEFEFSNASLSTAARKHSILWSMSPKPRTWSGSEHGYSLRSRGPPNDMFESSNESIQSKDSVLKVEQLDVNDRDENVCGKDEVVSHGETDCGSEENGEVKELESSVKSPEGKKTKRKRKFKYTISKTKRKREMACNDKNSSKVNYAVDQSLSANKYNFKLPPPHQDAILDLKVVGDLIFTASFDGTARLFDIISGVVLCTYQNHTDSVSSIQVVGKPQFTAGSPTFHVITGSEDCFIHVYDGKTGVLTQKRNCSEPVRCLCYRWDHLFIATDGGCGLNWNMKDKKLGEKVQFCGKGITYMLPHVEAGRKVLIVGAKTTPIMIRDAMSGLFLRTLEYSQLTVYSAVFDNNCFYCAGADKLITVYDYCAGTVKENIAIEASVSSLSLVKGHLVAVCYDGFVRIYRLPKGELVHSISINSSHKMYICGAVFRNKLILGNKKGEVVYCDLPDLTK